MCGCTRTPPLAIVANTCVAWSAVTDTAWPKRTANLSRRCQRVDRVQDALRLPRHLDAGLRTEAELRQVVVPRLRRAGSGRSSPCRCSRTPRAPRSSSGCRTPCSCESLNVSLPSGEYVYGTSHCDERVGDLLSRMAAIVMTLPVEPGSNTSETALDSEPPTSVAGVVRVDAARVGERVDLAGLGVHHDERARSPQPVAATCASSADCAFHCTSDLSVSCTESPCRRRGVLRVPAGDRLALAPALVRLAPGRARSGARRATPRGPASPTPLELTKPMTFPASVPFG